MNRDGDDNTDTFRDRMQNQNRRKKARREPDLSEHPEEDASDSILRGFQELPSLDLGYPEAAGHSSSFLLQQQMQVLHKKPLYEPDRSQRLHRELQDSILRESILRGLNLGYPEAVCCSLSFLQQRQQQQKLQHELRALEEQQKLQHELRALKRKQKMQHALDLLPADGFAVYGNPFSMRMNNLSTTTMTASFQGASSSSVPHFTAMNPFSISEDKFRRAPLRLGHNCTLVPLNLRSQLNKIDQGHLSQLPQLPLTQQVSSSSLPSWTQSYAALPATSAGHPITAEQDRFKTAANAPSASLHASNSQRLLGGLQLTADPRPPYPPLNNMILETKGLLYMSCDDNVLSDYQILLRQQIAFFVARQEDIDNFTPNRRKEVSVGQVGIRFRHCANLHPQERPKGAVYFPSTIRAIYQAAQNMATDHFANTCEKINPQVKKQLFDLQGRKVVSRPGYGGKKYWADGAVARGIYEMERGLQFRHGE